MKKLFTKNNLIAVLIALTLAFMAVGCKTFDQKEAHYRGEYATKGTYAEYSPEQSIQANGGTLKEIIVQVSTDGKYLLLLSAFDDSVIEIGNLYFIGYKFTLNGVEVDTAKLDRNKTSLYYATVALKTENGVAKLGAQDLYGNDQFTNYSIIAYEIEFETSFEEEALSLKNIRSYIAGAVENSAGEYDKQESVESTVVERVVVDKTALNAEIALEVSEQGDYTLASYEAYQAKLAEAKAVAGDEEATQERVDKITAELTQARLALTVRTVEEVEGANKAFRLTSGDSKEITLADYVNENSLSNITYEVVADKDCALLSAIENGKFTVTAGEVSENTNVVITVKVSYKGEQQLAVELALKITNEAAPVLSSEEIVKSYDIYTLENKTNITIDFAENVINESELPLTYSAKLNGEDITLEGSTYTFTFGSYSGEVVYETFSVVASFVANGQAGSVEYTYKLALNDTTAYRVANGSFNSGLEGWTLTNTYGNEPFAGVDNKSTFWAEGYVMNNVGNYFSAYADGASENSHGKLESSYFVVNSQYATYMLGGGGNHNVYITIENKAGEVLGLYRNTRFTDFPAGEYSLEERRAMIGNTVFLANFVGYKVSLADFMGEEVRFVIHDYASSGWGVVYFDELNTYYGAADVLPEGLLVAENLLANKEALNAELALEVSEQGDYTLASYEAYVAKLAEAKALVNDIAVTQATVDNAVNALTQARLALTVRAIEEVEDANKAFRIISNKNREITLTDYVNDNGLSNVTYAVVSNNALVAVGAIENGKFVLTAGNVNEDVAVTVTITVSYKGEQKLVVELAVLATSEITPTVTSQEIVKAYDIYALENKTNITIDFAKNVNNEDNLPLTYSVKLNGEDITLEGSAYTFTFGSYTGEVVYETFSVVASFVANGQAGSVEYTYKLALNDTTAYRVVNGNFNSGLEGWTLTNTYGNEPFAGVDNKSTFWVEGYVMNNVGNYFSAYADGASENSHGKLESSYFVVNSQYATYMLGGGGNHYVYITIENKAGEVLGLYRNTRFTDFPAGDYSLEERRAMIGNTVFLANFVGYKVSLAGFMGEEVRFVIHDYASSGWGVVYFDELNTYYGAADLLPEGLLVAENLLANKEALNAELALEVSEQGDYTLASYEAYVAKLAEAKALVNDIAVTQATVDNAVNALTQARLALTVRAIEEVEGANKAFRLTSGNDKEILLADYINVNGLSSITYSVKSNSELATVSALADGKFTVTAGNVTQATTVTVVITVSYKGEAKLAVELSIQITNDLAPTLFNQEVVEKYDIYALENKSAITLDFAKNVDNEGNLALTYSVKYNGEALTLNGTSYTFTFGTYSDVVVYETFSVVVSFVANGESSSIEYNYILAMTDSTLFQLANGGFEEGLEGWTKVGNIGDVSTESHYWVESWENNGLGYEFGMDGAKMFSAYAPGALEVVAGTLTSSTFTVGGSGFVTFKVGAMKDGNYVYVDVVNANTKQIIARYYNGLWAEYTNGLKSGCSLIAYKADLSAFMGEEVFFRVSDNADSGYGLFFADSFITYYESEPAEFNTATPVGYTVSGTIYDLFNGGFEMNNVQGWLNNGEIGVVTNATGYWGDNIPYGKDGEYLFTGVESFGADTMREGNRGVLSSSTFEIGGSGWISFMLGGGGNELCYVQVIDVATNEVLARYHQQAQQDAKLIQYVADLSAYIGRTARIQVVDYASSGWGCVSFDNVKTYYANKDNLPAGITANNLFQGTYDIANGSFETGNIDGWTMNITEAGAHNTLGWVTSNERAEGWYTVNDGRKDGNNLFTFYHPDGINCENTKGSLESSTFTLKQGAYLSFRFGGAGTREVNIQLCRKDGTVIATFYNEAPGKVNTEMYAYYYCYTGETADCFFRVYDNSTANYGCVVVDDFRVNLASAPEGFIAAIR